MESFYFLYEKFSFQLPGARKRRGHLPRHSPGNKIFVFPTKLLNIQSMNVHLCITFIVYSSCWGVFTNKSTLNSLHKKIQKICLGQIQGQLSTVFTETSGA